MDFAVVRRLPGQKPFKSQHYYNRGDLIDKYQLEELKSALHSLRHTCFTLLLKEGMDIVTLQELKKGSKVVKVNRF